MIIDEILDLSIIDIRGIIHEKNKNQEYKCWRSIIFFNGKKKSLGYYNDPFSAGLVYGIVKKEIIDFENMYITKTRNGTYRIRKYVKNKLESFGTFKSLEKARAERDLLEQYDWNLEKVCECVDETVNSKIIVNNRLVGEVY